jgi:hypothetical protein
MAYRLPRWFTMPAAVILAAVLVLGVAARYVVTAQATTSDAVVRRLTGVQATDIVCTTSFPFVDMPGMSITFTVTRGPDEVGILFQGQFLGGSSAAARSIIAFLVDGVQTPAFIMGEGTVPGSHGMNWVSTPLAAGTHTVTVQWHSFPSGEQICIEDRSLILLRG